MNAPYGLEVIDSCVDCGLRKGFCDFSSEVLRHLAAIAHQQTYPPGATLYMEGQPPRGVLILCSGNAKLTTCTREGKLFILRVVKPGMVLGLSAVLSDLPLEATAVTMTPCRLAFIGREPLLRFVTTYGEAGLHAAKVVSEKYQEACEEIRDILMAPSSTGKIAKLLLSWTTGGTAGERIRSLLTHEEMAQMIGASRETVTRVLGDFKRKELIRLEGSTLVIRNRSGLEDLVS